MFTGGMYCCARNRGNRFRTAGGRRAFPIAVTTAPPLRGSSWSRESFPHVPTRSERGIVTVAAGERLDELPIVQARIRPVAAPPTAVSRTRLTTLLGDPATAPVTTLVAPAGYGKTTVLGQWAAAEPRPVAWLTIDPGDNDP